MADDQEDKDKRKHPRIKADVPLEVSHLYFGPLVINANDISEGGVYVVNDIELDVPPVGAIVNVQVMGLVEEIPFVQAEVVRRTETGFAMHFLEDIMLKINKLRA
jgi:hypothetical protein